MSEKMPTCHIVNVETLAPKFVYSVCIDDEVSSEEVVEDLGRIEDVQGCRLNTARAMLRSFLEGYDYLAVTGEQIADLIEVMEKDLGVVNCLLVNFIINPIESLTELEAVMGCMSDDFTDEVVGNADLQEQFDSCDLLHRRSADEYFGGHRVVACDGGMALGGEPGRWEFVSLMGGPVLLAGQ